MPGRLEALYRTNLKSERKGMCISYLFEEYLLITHSASYYMQDMFLDSHSALGYSNSYFWKQTNLRALNEDISLSEIVNMAWFLFIADASSLAVPISVQSRGSVFVSYSCSISLLSIVIGVSDPLKIENIVGP